MIVLHHVLMTTLQIRDYHRRHPSARVVDEGEDAEDLLKEEPWIEFSGEVFLKSLCLAFSTPKPFHDDACVEP